MPRPEPKLTLTMFNVGHGDSFLLEWDNGKETEKWNCLIDAGSHPKTILGHLIDKKIEKLNLAVVSHFDSDHIAGFKGMNDHIEIAEYWSPYTPAIKKHQWLFGDRGKSAVSRAEEIEKEMSAADVTMKSPMSGALYKPAEGIEILVLSPPQKIYERLLARRDISDIISEYPTPIGILLEEEGGENIDEQGPATTGVFRTRTSDNVINRDLSSEDRDVFGGHGSGPSDKSIKIWTKQSGLDPEFFGNPFLNDTSLVFVVRVWTGTRWTRILFPGDMENWVYPAMEHSRDLYVDIYKATHHGGRVYIGPGIHSKPDEAIDSLMQTIRPKISLISANGKHGLPRTEICNSIIRWSSALYCAQEKTLESFPVREIQKPCCHDEHCCEELRFHKNGVVITVTDKGITGEPSACAKSPFATPFPIVEVRQHVVENSSVLTRLSEREMENHAAWLKKRLREIHNDRVKTSVVLTSEMISFDDLHNEFLGATPTRHLTKRQLSLVLEYGFIKRLLYSTKGRKSHDDDLFAYELPNENEMEAIWQTVKKKKAMLFFTKQEAPRDLSILYWSLERDIFCEWLERRTFFPKALISDWVWAQLKDKVVSEYDFYFYSPKDSMFSYEKGYKETGHYSVVILCKKEYRLDDLRNSVYLAIKNEVDERYRWKEEIKSFDLEIYKLEEELKMLPGDASKDVNEQTDELKQKLHAAKESKNDWKKKESRRLGLKKWYPDYDDYPKDDIYYREKTNYEDFRDDYYKNIIADASDWFAGYVKKDSDEKCEDVLTLKCLSNYDYLFRNEKGKNSYSPYREIDYWWKFQKVT